MPTIPESFPEYLSGRVGDAALQQLKPNFQNFLRATGVARGMVSLTSRLPGGRMQNHDTERWYNEVRYADPAWDPQLVRIANAVRAARREEEQIPGTAFVPTSVVAELPAEIRNGQIRSLVARNEDPDEPYKIRLVPDGSMAAFGRLGLVGVHALELGGPDEAPSYVAYVENPGGGEPEYYEAEQAEALHAGLVHLVAVQAFSVEGSTERLRNLRTAE